MKHKHIETQAQQWGRKGLGHIPSEDRAIRIEYPDGRIVGLPGDAKLIFVWDYSQPEKSDT